MSINIYYMKICKKCNIEKELELFSKDSKRKDGLSVNCKECVKEQRLLNKEKIKERNRLYRLENPDIVRERKRKYYEKNKEKIKEKAILKADIIRERRKVYYKNNIEKIRESKRIYRENNKEYVSEYSKKHYSENKDYYSNKYQENKEEISQRLKDFRKNNPEEARKRDKEKRDVSKESKRKCNRRYYDKTKVEWREYYRLRMMHKRNTDPLFNLSCIVKSCIRRSFIINGYVKSERTESILGCSISEFRDYIESLFESWMTWENRGLYNGELNYGWDLDHKIPISSAVTEEDVIRLNHYTNLQPLCSYTNRYIKIDKILYR